MGRPACRIGDIDMVHCIGFPRRAMGSRNVFVNWRPWSRQLDFNTPHLLPCKCPICCCIHTAPIARGSSSVFVNGRGAGRMFDGVARCTYVAWGSWNVFCG